MPSYVTCRSSIASRSAACVLGLARLISSPTNTLVNTAPGLKTNSEVPRSQIDTPVMSEGRRSGVDCTRLKVQSIEVASDLASSVFPTPGTSSMRTCPSAMRHRSSRSIASRLPRMTVAILSEIVSNAVRNQTESCESYM